MNRMSKMIKAAVVVTILLLLTGCKKSEIQQGGEGTNFPYTWQVKNNGTVVIKLDGSYAPDYAWTAENTDDQVIKVEVIKKEKRGIITYRVTPLADGTADITFTRQRVEAQDTETQGAAVAEEAEEEVPVEKRSSDRPQGPAPDQVPAMEVERVPGSIRVSGEGVDEELVAAQSDANDAAEETVEAYNVDLERSFQEQLQVKDKVSEITFMIEVGPTGKKGKLCAGVRTQFGEEYSGVIRGADSGLDYKLWENAAGSWMVRIPFDPESWVASWEGEYLPEWEADAQAGVTTMKPERIAGRDEIVAIRSLGVADGDECFEISGLAPGKATVEFASTTQGRKLILEIRMMQSGAITVLSHRVEG